MDQGVTLEDEVRSNLDLIIAMAQEAKLMIPNKQWMKINNQITRIERTAREASYCIFDMGDLIG